MPDTWGFSWSVQLVTQNRKKNMKSTVALKHKDHLNLIFTYPSMAVML